MNSLIKRYDADMVNLNTPFRKTLSFSNNTSSYKKRVFKVALNSVFLAKSVLKYKK